MLYVKWARREIPEIGIEGSDSIMTPPELSIVIPFLNEEHVLPLLRQRLENVRNRLSQAAQRSDQRN
jgi:hypothetical protein